MLNICRKNSVSYVLLNGLFHFFHAGIISFVMIGWIFPSLRLAHLVFMILMLGSWFLVGRWLGAGYCPITDWHWKLKDSLGEGRPKGTYFHLVLQNFTRKKLNSDAIDKGVLVATMVIAGLSLILNLM
jgi:hypothetical protein